MRNKPPWEKIAAAGIAGSKAGKRAAELFAKVDRKATILSRDYPVSKQEIIDRCLSIVKTTANDFDKAFDIVENEVKNHE